MMEQPPFQVNKVAKIIESKEVDGLLECIKTLELRATPIGEGGNAVVYAAEGTPFEKVCLKKVRQQPVILGNNIDDEHRFQMEVRNAGVNTPLSLISLETNEGPVLIMERVNGHTIEDICKKPSLLPEGFDYAAFCAAFDAEMAKMHTAGIYHRDLHLRNVMMDTAGKPVIIDFGTATHGTGSDFTYEETVTMYNPNTNRYEQKSGYFKDDLEMAKKLKGSLRQALAQNALTKQV